MFDSFFGSSIKKKNSSQVPPHQQNIPSLNSNHHAPPQTTTSSEAAARGGTIRIKSTNPKVNLFFQKVSTMLNNFKDILLDKKVRQQQQGRNEENNNKSTSSSSVMGKVECYALLSDCSYQGQVEALEMLYEWFADFIRQELQTSVLMDMQKQNNNGNKNQNQQQQQQQQQLSVSARDLMKKIAGFLASYSKLVTFARICYLALEQPQFLGKYFSPQSSSSGNNNNSLTSSSSHLFLQQNSNRLLQQRQHQQDASSSSSFIVTTLKTMLRSVASETLRPFILTNLPKVLQQSRVAKQRKVLRMMMADEDEDDRTMTEELRRGFEEDLLAGGQAMMTDSAGTTTTSGTSTEDGIENNENSDLLLYAYMISFFRNLSGGNNDNNNAALDTESTTNNSRSNNNPKLQEAIFRREFFDSYLDSLRNQFAGLAKDLMSRSPRNWSLSCFSYLRALLVCEEEMSRILFHHEDQQMKNNNGRGTTSASSNSGPIRSPHVLECIRAARGSFLSVCAVPLIHNTDNGISALLKRGDYHQLAKLLVFVSSEPGAIPQMKKAIEDTIRAQLKELFQQQYLDVVDQMDEHTRNNSNNSSSTSSSSSINQQLHTVRENFFKHLLGFISRWNYIVALTTNSEKNSSKDNTNKRESSSFRILLERAGRNAFREEINNFILKGCLVPLSSSSSSNSFRTTGALHLADVLAGYCNSLLRGELKGDLIILNNNNAASSGIVTTTNSSNINDNNASATDAASSSSSLDAETINVIDLISQLVSFFKDKDLVIELHRIRTAKRLLEKKAATLDLECVLAHKLSHVVDMSQTRKFEGMFADVERWSDEMEKYEKFLQEENNNNDEENNNNSSASNAASSSSFTVSVLTSSQWPNTFRGINPITCPVDFSAFPSLDRHIQNFLKFYKNTHMSRKLTWQLEPSGATLTLQPTKKQAQSKELHVGWPQAFVLLVVDELSSKRAAAAAAVAEKAVDDDNETKKNNKGTGLKEIISVVTGTTTTDNDENQQQQDHLTFISSELHKALISLSKIKGFQILRPVSGEKDSDGEETFEMNPDFSSRLRKITVPRNVVAVVSDKKNNKESNNNSTSSLELPKEILAQREQVLDACIVRIMKSRQRMKLGDMVNLVTASIKAFPVTFKEIKKRIESLMEREFLKREDDEEEEETGGKKDIHNDVFSYVA